MSEDWVPEKIRPPTLTGEELKKFFAIIQEQSLPDDAPDRHKDYLPLNLWDQTKDE